MSMSQLQWLNMMAAKNSITKKEFGRIMHDPNSTEEEKKEALRKLEDACGYENLPD